MVIVWGLWDIKVVKIMKGGLDFIMGGFEGGLENGWCFCVWVGRREIKWDLDVCINERNLVEVFLW